MKWTKKIPEREGAYWVRVSGYGKLFPHAEDEIDIIVYLVWSSEDNIWEVIEVGGDCIYEVNDKLGVLYWSDESIKYPTGFDED